jgi:SAM-dependent methyltransferase
MYHDDKKVMSFWRTVFGGIFKSATIIPIVRSTTGKNMPDNKTVYAHHGNEYEALIAREDYQGNIARAIAEIIDVDGLDVLDLGAGTGRLTLLLAPRARSIRAFDVSSEMLRVCREKLIASGLSNWQVDVADHRISGKITQPTLSFPAGASITLRGTLSMPIRNWTNGWLKCSVSFAGAE